MRKGGSSGWRLTRMSEGPRRCKPTALIAASRSRMRCSSPTADIAAWERFDLR